MPFLPNPKQRMALDKMGGTATHLLLYGGSRSGKSFIAVRAIIIRAVKAANSRHLIARYRMAHIKASIVADTFPKVMAECFPELELNKDYWHNKSLGYWEFINGAQIWYAGLDDKDRTEKILGMEFATIMLEECSQISWPSRGILVTRLAQKTSLKLKAYYCENPPYKTHWTYKLFVERISPDTNKPVHNPDDFAFQQLNPIDNAVNLAPGYMDQLEGLSERQKIRFKEGQFGDAGEAALWTPETLAQARIREDDADLEDFLRIVVAVDPSGASSSEDAHRDEIGIVVAGLRASCNKALVLEDCTMKGSPAEWGKAVVLAAQRWGAERVIGEDNYGGAMVQYTVQSAAAAEGVTLPYRAVHASRGKVVRAEPISALYDTGMVEHMPGLQLLEDEMVQFTTFGYTGDRSPNRADAAIWALTDLFPSVIRAVRNETAQRHRLPKVNLGHSSLKRRRK